MPLDIGLIGLPNVGKSTLFNALTHGHAEAENYAFCTVDPNIGVVEVADERLESMRALVNPRSCVQASIRFVDIAGLVKGAHRGEGLGNQFLEHIRQADALVQVVRCFEDGEVAHVDGNLEPLRDIETLETELLLADLNALDSARLHLEKVVRSDPRSTQKLELATVQRAFDAVNGGHPVRELDLAREEREALKGIQLLTLKPMLYVANMGEESDGVAAERLAGVRAHCGTGRVVALAARLEAELAELDPEDRSAFAEEMGELKGGVDRLVRAGYELLDLVTFYTLANEKLQAWQLPRGMRAPQAAGRIHSDMEAGFIRAEVAHYDALVSAGSMGKLREEGLLRVEGKDYEVHDGDVIQFLFKG